MAKDNKQLTVTGYELWEQGINF